MVKKLRLNESVGNKQFIVVRFPGFSYSIIDPSGIEDSRLMYFVLGTENVPVDVENEVLNRIDEIECKYYFNEMSKKYLVEWNNLMKTVIPSWKDASFVEYDGGSDQIVARLNIDDCLLDDIISKIMDNRTKFSKYLRDNFTSGNGYYSFYSNNPDEWLLKGYNKWGEYEWGSIFDFCLYLKYGYEYSVNIEYSLLDDMDEVYMEGLFVDDEKLNDFVRQLGY